jgi:transposase
MRGVVDKQGVMLLVYNLEDRVHRDHPLRRIKVMAAEELKELSPVFKRMHSHTGRPSIPPERILKSLLLIALYSVRASGNFVSSWSTIFHSDGFWT